MRLLSVALLVSALAAPLPASAGELALSFNHGRVTLKATDASLRQVLTEWARLGHTRIVGLEKVTGGALTLELVNVPEKQALEILLRTVAGYIAAPRPGGPTDVLSRFDRLLLLPTSVASAAPMGGPRPAAFAAPSPPPAQFPDPIQLANEEPAPNDMPAAPVPIFNPNGEAPPLPGQGAGPGQLRPPDGDDPDAPAPAAPPPLVTARPGVIPVPQAPPRP